MFKVIDATKHKGFNSYSNDDIYVKNPYVVMLIDFDGRERPLIIKLEDRTEIIGYPSIVEAKNAYFNYCNKYKNDTFCYVVTKNSDFTEGRGPMLLDCVFSTIEAAERYVEKQKGIYGSKQYCNITFGINIRKELYGSVFFNGYKIEKVKMEN